jgi:transcription-repair coupling factor (superfamily II helicase)
MALTMKELQEMEVGDFIVHVDFGIGKFGGLVRVPIASASPNPSNRRGTAILSNASGGSSPSPSGDGRGGASGEAFQEVIRIIYQNNDKVDVSIHSLYKISKYRSGSAGEAPRLSTLGTGAWDRLKERTKKRIKDIARDLIRLYAKRRHEKGFAYSADSFMQHELEACFLYEDTPDQLKATQDVKADMERAQPMDRLICGDVGFGKTEVAIRAAFKAACDSKQVPCSCPPPVCLPALPDLRDRMKDFVRVGISRGHGRPSRPKVIEDLASQGRHHHRHTNCSARASRARPRNAHHDESRVRRVDQEKLRKLKTMSTPSPCRPRHTAHYSTL